MSPPLAWGRKVSHPRHIVATSSPSNRETRRQIFFLLKAGSFFRLRRIFFRLKAEAKAEATTGGSYESRRKLRTQAEDTNAGGTDEQRTNNHGYKKNRQT